MTRMERVNELLKRTIADVIRTKISDSRIGFISILSVRTSKDLAVAKVFYSQIGALQEKLKTKRGLRSAAGAIRSELGKELRMGSIPELYFELDESHERAAIIIDKINALPKA